ncbi:MAG TPA: hypothetical protein VF855_06405 [Acidimicrobiales bacterium]
MVMLAVVIVAVAVVGVFAIAAAVIGREAHRLDAVAPRTVYELEEAVTYVADHLPAASQARLTHDEVRQLLRWHLVELQGRGLAPADVTDRPQDIDEMVVVEETDAAGYLIGRADQAGMDVQDVDVVEVVEAHLAYLDAIGAVGPPADDW